MLIYQSCASEKKVVETGKHKREVSYGVFNNSLYKLEFVSDYGTITYAYKDTAWHPIPRGEMVNWAFHNSQEVIPLQAVEGDLVFWKPKICWSIHRSSATHQPSFQPVLYLFNVHLTC